MTESIEHAGSMKEQAEQVAREIVERVIRECEKAEGYQPGDFTMWEVPARELVAFAAERIEALYAPLTHRNGSVQRELRRHWKERVAIILPEMCVNGRRQKPPRSLPSFARRRQVARETLLRRDSLTQRPDAGKV